MSDNTVKNLKVNLKHVDKITQNTLKFFFRSNLNAFAEITDDNDQDSEVFILDYELGVNIELLDQLCIEKLHAVVLHMPATKKHQNENQLWMEKPLQSSKLKNHLRQVYQQLRNINEQNSIEPTKAQPIQSNNSEHSNSHLSYAIGNESQKDMRKRYKAHKHVGSNKDIDPSKPDEVKRINLTPKKYLYHHLTKAKAMAQIKQTDIKINTLFGQIFYEKIRQQFHFKLDENKIKFMQSSPIFTDTTIEKIENITLKDKTGTISRDAQEMIWETAIFASKGRVATNTDLLSGVNMRSWPNYSRLKIFRYAIQISAAWSQNSLSLIDSAKQLNIPQRYVFTLYCAMHAINCANIVAEQSTDAVVGRKKRSIFSKILSHIFKK